MLGGVPLALGTGTGAETAAAPGHRDRRRADIQPAADTVYDAVIYLYFDRQRAASRTQRSGRERPIPVVRHGGRMSISEPFIHRPVPPRC